MPSKTDIELVRRLAAADHGLAVVITQTKDGSPHAAVVNAGVMDHPLTGHAAVALVSRGDAARLKHVRRRPSATIVFRSGWEWVAVEGPTSLAGPDDTMAGLRTPIPRLLREVFVAAGGTHNDWDEYDRVMARERRTAVFVEMARVYTNRRSA